MKDSLYNKSDRVKKAKRPYLPNILGLVEDLNRYYYIIYYLFIIVFINLCVFLNSKSKINITN